MAVKLIPTEAKAPAVESISNARGRYPRRGWRTLKPCRPPGDHLRQSVAGLPGKDRPG